MSYHISNEHLVLLLSIFTVLLCTIVWVCVQKWQHHTGKHKLERNVFLCNPTSSGPTLSKWGFILLKELFLAAVSISLLGGGGEYHLLINNVHCQWGYIKQNWNGKEFPIYINSLSWSWKKKSFIVILQEHSRCVSIGEIGSNGRRPVWKAFFYISFTHKMLNCSFRTVQAGLWSPKFHFALVNPIAHYPVHCIRPLISPFNSYSLYLLGRKKGFLINLLTAINKGIMQLCSVDLISSMKAEEVRNMVNIAYFGIKRTEWSKHKTMLFLLVCTGEWHF